MLCYFDSFHHRVSQSEGISADSLSSMAEHRAFQMGTNIVTGGYNPYNCNHMNERCQLERNLQIWK